MRVGDVYQRHTRQLELVSPDAPITEVIALVARDRGSRSVFVVDDDHSLRGIIRMQDILRRVGVKHVGVVASCAPGRSWRRWPGT